MDLDSFLDRVQTDVSDRFERSEKVISFRRFLEDFSNSPGLHLRSVPQYLLEMFDHFGTRQGSRIGRETKRFCLFDLESRSIRDGLVGQERVQNEVYQHVLSFSKRGKVDKMLLLHGPNGSGKTTVVDSIVRGLERFSQTPNGALYTFSWIFSDREGRLSQIGFETDTNDLSDLESFAHLDEKDVTSRFTCAQKDAPIFLVPQEYRAELIEEALRKSPVTKYPDLCYNYFLEGDLCPMCKKIYESLLIAYQGDWKKIVRHIQVERFYISKRFRTGAVSIEPQGNIDASSRPVLSDRAWNVPQTLRNVSLFQPVGDIIDANRGVLEYSDFLKRPLEANKYLLTTCEQGTVNLTNCLAYLDLIIFGTANEKQLSVFKLSPDFSSFKARIELLSVPYLLRYSTEADLYKSRIRVHSKGRHVTPHAGMVSAMWAVLTRLKKARPENYEESLRGIIKGLTPLEKAVLYDSGEAPDRMNEDQKKRLRASVLKIRKEFEEEEGEFEGLLGSEYEGRRGVSPRAMMGVLARAAENPTYKCLTPMSILDSLEEIVKDVSLYDFLRIAPDDGYHDMPALIKEVRKEYYRWVTAEVYDSISLIDEGEYDRVFLAYFRHVKAFDAREKIYDAARDVYEPPNEELMSSIEKQVEITEPPAEFRSNIMTRIAAWSLDNPKEKIKYHALFAEIYKALQKQFYRERDRILMLIEKDILKHGTDEFSLLSSAEQVKVKNALSTMKSKYGYCDNCARDVIAYVLKQRFELEESREATESSADGKAEKEEE